jgi:hypothetical protein
MRLLSKASTVILGAALALPMAVGHASASVASTTASASPAQAAASAKADAIPRVIDAFWFRTRFRFSSGIFGETACYIQAGALKAQYPNDIDATDCLLDYGEYYLWLHGTDRVYELFHG